MSRRGRFAFAALAAAVLVLLLTLGAVVSQEIQQVFVANFPDVQTVKGEVTVDGPLHLSELRSFKEIVVQPVRPTETTRLVEAGTLTTDGFASVVLSIHGVTRGDVKKPGTVGVILIPDEPRVQAAFNELGLMHFSLETSASGVSVETPYFASAQPRYTVAFPSYRVLLYNTTDKTVTVDVFAYLTI